MRIILYTGKGGVGKTTTSAATALRLADRGLKKLLLSTDSAHSLGDALGLQLSGEPSPIAPGLDAVQIDTQRRFEAAWHEVQRYLLELLNQGGVDPITAEELTVLPGIEEVLALLAVRDYAEHGRWDVLVLDCAPTAETLRLLALPEALAWYLQRVFPLHRTLARGIRPLTALLGRGSAIPPESAFDAVLRLTDELAGVRAMLADPRLCSVRLVLTPEAVVTAKARRTFTALALYGYQVDEVVANRIFPAAPDGSAWQQSWVSAQATELAAIRDSFAGLPLRQLGYRPREPIGLTALREVADELYGAQPGSDPAASVEAGPLLSVTVLAEPDLTEQDGTGQDRTGQDVIGPRYQLSVNLPLAERGEVSASRSGDELIVTVAGNRRVLALPSGLRRCEVTGGSVGDGQLVLWFRPDPRFWRPA
ncbi:MAG: ArsA family ATPase [Jatrophihabitans sp.]